MQPIVSAAWLRERLGAPGLAVADCRFDLADPAAGAAAYALGHIPGAVHLDLERDLSSPSREHGGRHPLPDPQRLAARLGELGIGPGVTVVAYDGDGTFAPRLWWLLRYLGHDDATVLDGGLPAWRAAGGALTTEAARPEPRRFVPRLRPEMAVGVEAVRNRTPDTVLVDARTPERFHGGREPLDRVPGHIPGAVDLWWEEGLTAERTRLPAEAQRARFAAVVGDRPAIFYCGSGVTACCNLLALAIAGRWDVPLYPGSYSDWSSYPENPIETGGGA